MDLLIRLLVGVLIIWLVKTIEDAVGLAEPANKIVFIVAIVLVVLWLVTGQGIVIR